MQKVGSKRVYFWRGGVSVHCSRWYLEIAGEYKLKGFSCRKHKNESSRSGDRTCLKRQAQPTQGNIHICNDYALHPPAQEPVCRPSRAHHCAQQSYRFMHRLRCL